MPLATLTAATCLPAAIGSLLMGAFGKRVRPVGNR